MVVLVVTGHKKDVVVGRQTGVDEVDKGGKGGLGGNVAGKDECISGGKGLEPSHERVERLVELQVNVTEHAKGTEGGSHG